MSTVEQSCGNCHCGRQKSEKSIEMSCRRYAPKPFNFLDLTNLFVLNALAEHFHNLSAKAGWWHRHDNELRAVKIALIHSEISEALEGLRKNKQDEHLPHRKSIEVELADTLIRIFDLAGEMKLDLDGAIREKSDYNQRREDHKLAQRAQEHGKQF